MEMRVPWGFAVGVIACAAGSANAGAAVSLSNQGAWTDSDKAEFLNYLDSGKEPPISGQVRSVRPALSEARDEPSAQKPFYLTVEAVGGVTVTEAQGSAPSDQEATIGPRLTFGGHLFSWIRFFAAFEYDSLNELHLDGTRSGVDHFQIPIGLELCLIPLGSPQTQYILLRGGFGTHLFNTGTASSLFVNPVVGVEETWDLGLGYEWQIRESHLRFHALAATQIAFGFQTSRFYSVDLTAGVAYLF